jgi:hypothetical protein
MRAPVSMQIQKEILLPNDRPEIVGLKLKINEILDRLDEYLRILRSDIEIMDFRELPPHYSVSHSKWKFVENAGNGDLQLYHKHENIWAPSGWAVIGS